MKHRNAFFETFRTKEGKVYFLTATVFLIASFCVNTFISDAWQPKKFVLLGCGLFMFIGCVLFTQYVGAVQNQIDKEERENAGSRLHPGKKK